MRGDRTATRLFAELVNDPDLIDPGGNPVRTWREDHLTTSGPTVTATTPSRVGMPMSHSEHLLFMSRSQFGSRPLVPSELLRLYRIPAVE